MKNNLTNILMCIFTMIIGYFLFARLDYQWQLVFGQGKYNEQSTAVSLAVQNELRKQQLCDMKNRCPLNLEIEGDNSLFIDKKIYNIEGNEKVLAKYLEAMLIHGKAEANGVPIKISGYEKTHSYYMDKSNEHKPFLIMEIK